MPSWRWTASTNFFLLALEWLWLCSVSGIQRSSQPAAKRSGPYMTREAGVRFPEDMRFGHNIGLQAPISIRQVWAQNYSTIRGRRVWDGAA